MNNELIDSALNKFNLGRSVSIEMLDGGEVNDIYKVMTEQGKAYVIKVINVDAYFKFYHMPKDILEFSLNFSEEIAFEANAQGIPTVFSAAHNQQRFIEINNQILLVYPYIDGSYISEDEIDDTHVKAIAELLANLHRVSYDNTLLEIASKRHEFIKPTAIKMLQEKIWQHAFDELKGTQFEYLEKKMRILGDEINLINDMLIQSVDKNYDFIICHNDIRPKNILWHGLRPNIIDWEAAGYIPRAVDYLDTMISWCAINTTDVLSLDPNKYHLFHTTYHKNFAKTEITDDIICIVIIKWLSWIKFCLAKARLTSDLSSLSQLINYSLNYLIFIFNHFQELKKLI